MSRTKRKEPDQPALFATPKAEATKPVAEKAPEKKPKTARAVAVAQPAKVTSLPAPTNMLAIIAQAAANPAVDVAKMQALLDMQRQLETEQGRRAFTNAFIELQNELPIIRPDGKIEIREKESGGARTGRVQQATPYATFQAIIKAVKAPLRKNGFSLSFATEPSPDGTRIVVKGFLDHVDGHQRTTAFPLPAEVSGSKNNVQGWGSTLSYGKRYATIALLNIISGAPEDADLDGAIEKAKSDDAVVLITPKQIDEVTKAVEFCGVGVKKFCEHYGIAAIKDLPASSYSDALTACKNYKEKAGGSKAQN